MKFRCEREILADAFSTAGRAATSRSGTLPVLSGLRLDVRDGQLTVTGTDLESPMGRDLVPVEGRENAERLRTDHGGDRVLGWAEVDARVIDPLFQ